MQPSSGFMFGVVGGGIVGLAVAARLSQFGSTVLFEQHDRFIAETSSRNSQVVHAGIYYPPHSLKTTMSIAGNQHIWNLADRFPGHIVAKKIGKWIGAVDDAESVKLHKIAANMSNLGVPYQWLSQSEMQQGEPRVAFKEAILSPNTGIVDVHTLADFYRGVIQNNNDSLALANCKIVNVQTQSSGVVVKDACGDSVECQSLVVSAGLHTDTFWRSGGFTDSDGHCIEFDQRYKTHFCKGRYVGYRDHKVVSRLVYPCPLENIKGLGVHSVIDMSGAVRFGPDAVYTDRMDDLDVANDPEFLDLTFHAVKKFIPSIEREKMFVDFAGMRPKLSGEGESFRDFLIDFLPKSQDRVVVLGGIESPGLTASSSIADSVAKMLIGEKRLHEVPSIWN